VWHTQTGQLATIAKTGQRFCSFLTWGEVIPSQSKTKKSSTYKLLSAVTHKVYQYTLDFDIYTMQYALNAELLQLPSSGLERSYYCGLSLGDTMLAAGSHAGELVLFQTRTSVFRSCVPISQGGLLALAAVADGHGRHIVYCGCGDGKLVMVLGADQDWEKVGERQLGGPVLSITVSGDGNSLLAGTSEGNIYLLDAITLALMPNGNPANPEAPLLASHTRPVSCIAFGASSETFVTGAGNGFRKWELSHYTVEYAVTIRPRNKQAAEELRPECAAIRGGKLVTGWSDGSIYCHDEGSGQQLWEIPGSHRGGVSKIALTPLYLLTGGRDGSVRVWSDEPSHALVGNFDEHRASVTGLLVDHIQPNIVYSCSEDKTLVTIDLAQARRTHSHVVKDGALTGLAQSPAGEMERLTCDAAGGIKWWDADVSEQPLSMMITYNPQDRSEERKLTHIAISPAVHGSGGGEYLLAATVTGDLQMWDLRDPGQSRLLAQGSAHSDAIAQAEWSPDGKQVVSVGKDSCICVWNFYGAA